MKYTLLLCSLLLLQPAYALEFNRCMDENGDVHYTNLPLSTLDANCKQRVDYYSLRLNRDYRQLRNSLKNPARVQSIETKPGIIEQVSDAMENVLDADKALEQLLENTRDARENPASRFFRARTEAVGEILKAD